MNERKIIVTKASGNKAVYSAEQLRKSLHKSGAEDDTINFILHSIEPQLYDEIPTKKIYRIAYAMLKKTSKQQASKYKLKAAIFELGPSGYPFELFIAEILKHKGYKVKTGKIIYGKCVKHEVDVIAEKEDKHFIIECKFHQSAGIICDVKVPLYIHARFNDIENQEHHQTADSEKKYHQGWVVTNTRFSSDAVKYGVCAGLHLLGWDYPHKASLKDQIDEAGLYPITCLHTLTRIEKQQILDKQIVLCKDLINQESVLLKIGINQQQRSVIINEAKKLCDGNIPN